MKRELMEEEKEVYVARHKEIDKNLSTLEDYQTVQSGRLNTFDAENRLKKNELLSQHTKALQQIEALKTERKQIQGWLKDGVEVKDGKSKG